MVFSRVYAEITDLLIADTPVFIQGKFQKDEKGNKIIADRIVHFEEAENRWTTTLYLNLDMTRLTQKAITDLSDILKSHPGNCKGLLRLRHPNRSEIVMELPDDLKVKADMDLKKEIRAIFGRGVWETVCTPAAAEVRNYDRPARNRSFS